MTHSSSTEVIPASRPWSDPWRLVAVAIAYLAAHKLAYLIPGSSGVVAAIWPASGVALAALLLNPPRLWPRLLAVTAGVNFTVELIAGRGLHFELGLVAANLLETFGSAWIITRWSGRPVTFRRVDEVMALLFAALVVNGVSAALGAGVLTLQSGRPFWLNYRTWWTGDALGLYLITPLIVAWVRPGVSPRRLAWPTVAEAVGTFGLAALFLWVYFGPSQQNWLHPHSYLMFLPLIWAALRLGQRGTITLLVLTAITEIGATALGWGAIPLGGSDPIERVLRIQLFMGTKCIVALFLAASFAERRASEDSLRASESRLRTLSDHLPDTMVFQSVQERTGSPRFVHVSAGVEHLHGLTPEALRRDPDAFHRQLLPEDREVVAAAEAAALKSMTVFDRVARTRRPDGEVRWMHLRSRPRRLPDGRVVWDGIETDVTERRQMEEALRGSEEKFSKVFRSSPVAISITALSDGSFVDVNAAMERFLGYARSELMGHTTLELGLWRDERDRRLVVEQLARTGQVDGLELCFRMKSGADAFALYSAELIEIRGSRCILSVLADVTARKRAQDELRRVNRALRTISNCNQAMVRARDELSLLADVCQVMVEDGGHKLAWVGYPERDDLKSIRVAGAAGESAGCLQGVPLSWGEGEEGRGPVGAAVRTAQPVACHDYLKDPSVATWRAAALATGFRSSLALPLKFAGEVLGVLSIYSEDPRVFDDEEIKLHSELADDLAFGLQALRERRRHEAAETEVRRLLHEAERSRSALLSILEDQRRSEEALLKVNERYARHETAISTLSRSYALKPEDLNGVLRDICQVVARAIEVGRVSVWTYNATHSSIVCLELFERDPERHSQGGELTRVGHEAYFNALDCSDVIAATDAATDARTAALGPAYLQAHDIGAMLDVPLHARGGPAGVVCCEHLGGPRQWTPDEQTFVVAVANLVSMLLAQLEQQALESQLRQNQKLEALGTLAGGIAHDFNNILGAIISFTELARMDHPYDAELQENLGEVLKASKRAAGLVRQILAFSRQQRQERRQIQLAPVVREALVLIRSTLPATIEIRQEIAEQLPPVLADPNQIHQVVMNLCANAGHAMRGRTGVLRVRLELVGVVTLSTRDSHPGGDRQVRLTISDSGHGMEPTTLDRIFDPFFTTKGPGEGTGLGLAVVHGIVRDHDGTIEVMSEPGVGTTFHLKFPAAMEEPPMPIPEVPSPAPAAGHRILFVDDEVPLGEAARRLLGRYGFEVETHSRPEDALSLVRREPDRFDAVITDLTMPTMSGTELAADILELRSRLPVFVMTGNAGDLTTETVRALGVSDLVTKPVDYQALAVMLSESIARYRGRLA